MAYIGKEPANVGQRTIEDTYTATAGQTVFTLTAVVDYESDIIVSINGVTQTNAAFGLGGIGNKTLTFVSGMIVGDVIRVLHTGYKPMTVTVADNIVTTQKILDANVIDSKIASMSASKLTGALPAISGAALTNLPASSSPEVYGFNVDANGQLIVTTTNSGADNITAATYATFDEVVFAVTGFTWSTSGTDLIATI